MSASDLLICLLPTSWNSCYSNHTVKMQQHLLTQDKARRWGTAVSKATGQREPPGLLSECQTVPCPHWRKKFKGCEKR